ncbi:MAG: carbamoyltransferase C-terminal domain-containing protein [Acidobacteriota bacterium]
MTVMDESGEVLFAAAEQSFSRNKDDMGFPKLALAHVRARFGTAFEAVVTVRLSARRKVMRDVQFLWDSYRRGLALPAPAVILKGYLEKLRKGRAVERGARSADLDWIFGRPLVEVSHHDAHAASAYWAGGTPGAATMTLDGQGDDRYSAGFYQGEGSRLSARRMYYLNEVSVGYAYILTTSMLGFHGGRHAGKVTGLAAHGARDERCLEEMERFFAEHWLERPEGGHLTYANFLLYHPEGKAKLREMRRTRFGAWSDFEMAYAAQQHLEKRVLALVDDHVRSPAGTAITLAGGVFGNVRLNQKIKERGFASTYIQPAMGDTGLSLGAAYATVAERHGVGPRPLASVYLGPGFGAEEIRATLDRLGVRYEAPSVVEHATARLLAEGKVVARFDGRLEFGPRALGNRSILYRTEDKSVNDWLNVKLRRSEFMPFAPVTLAERAGALYEGLGGAELTSKFMNMTFDCTEAMRRQSPAVVHVDGTARPQILAREDNPSYHEILSEYERLTGVPTLINTSFNMHEEPIVHTPEDAVRAFRAAELDALAIGPFLVSR